ncbi:MAG: hypothetical protein M0Q21_09180 [Ignavibacteriaceae bacterium]|nr:hypothetical protein [Ignavibacteriaceae bacterium]
MKRISFLLVTLFLLTDTFFPQESIKPNPEFYHTWLQRDFYEGLMNGKTPNELHSLLALVTHVYFYENSESILIGSFYEGVHQLFKVINRDTIEVPYPGTNKIEFVLTLTVINDKTVLVIKREDKTYFLASLDDKYHVENGIDYFINDKFFTGNYVAAEDSSLKITFTSDGGVKGLNNFNEYRVPVVGVFVPRDFDCVSLNEIITEPGRRKVKDHLLLYWEKSKDTLILYNVSPSLEDEMDHEKHDIKIGDKYLTLKKVD